MKINVKLTEGATMPAYSKEGDAGLDFVASDVEYTDLYTEYKTGVHLEIPCGFVGLMFPRSSCSNYCQILSNCVGVIDSNYRGEIKFRFKTVHFGSLAHLKTYQKGDKIGQLIVIPIPKVELVQVDELSETERGEQGFGSSGN